MKNITKRLFTIIMSLTLIITMIPSKVSANEFSYSEIIAPKYDEVRSFSDDLAAVMQNEKWGYIDVKGNTVIEFKYDMAYSFSENKAVVGIEEKDIDSEGKTMYWGVIDRDGKYSPLLQADGSRFGTMSDSGYDDDDYEYIPSQQTNQFFYNGVLVMGHWDGTMAFGPDGKQIFPGGYSLLHAPTEGIVPVYFPGSDFIGYIDEKTGKELFEDRYFSNVRPFNQGLAAVQLFDEETYDYYWAFMDQSGKLLKDIRFTNFYVKNTYTEYQIFNDNSLASIMNYDGKWGAIDKTGKTVFPFKYDVLRVFTEGLASFSRGGKYGFIDIYGNEVIKPQFDDVSGFYNGIAVARVGKDAYCIDKTGKKIDGTDSLPIDSYFVESGYDENGDPKYLVYSPGKYVVIKDNNKFGFGEIVFTPSLPTADEMSSWALEEVKVAIENKLVPTNLQNMYKTDITRSDFAALVVKEIEEVTGKDIDDVVKEKTGKDLYELISKYPFKDTTNANVIAAQALGIINGKSEGIFAPYANISRQEAASLLMRTAKFLGKKFTPENNTFNDSENIANYAKEAVDYVAGLGVMKDKGKNNFGPKDNYSREQAYITINRLFDILKVK